MGTPWNGEQTGDNTLRDTADQQGLSMARDSSASLDFGKMTGSSPIQFSRPAQYARPLQPV